MQSTLPHMKPAPHCRPNGTLTRPVGTLGEMLSRAYAPSPRPYGNDHWRAWLANITRCPQRRRELLDALGLEGGR